jgi:MerR family transcriptional regulator, light-induced transcriptional regulator
MKTFSIKELEVLSGIKTHTIRIWEFRYSVFNPKRTTGNARRYSVDEMIKLLRLSLLNKSGYKVSRLYSFSNEDLQKTVEELKDIQQRMDRAVNDLIICMYKVNTEELESTLNDCFLTWPAETVIDEIIYPFLNKVGLLSQGKQLTEEHLVVTAVRKKLLWSIERIDAPKPNGKTVLLFLSGERQLDLQLLYLYYHLKKNGYEVLYMGVDISAKNIRELLSLKKPHYAITYLPKKNSLSLQQLSDEVEFSSPQTTLFVVDGIGEVEFANICKASAPEIVSTLLPSVSIHK